jgi:pantoate--beta-alanine ligase
LSKDFEIVQPTNAYFEKRFSTITDHQKMGPKINFLCNVVIALYREKNGLAMSSRNERLQPKKEQQQLYL